MRIIPLTALYFFILISLSSPIFSQDGFMGKITFSRAQVVKVLNKSKAKLSDYKVGDSVLIYRDTTAYTKANVNLLGEHWQKAGIGIITAAALNELALNLVEVDTGKERLRSKSIYAEKFFVLGKKVKVILKTD